MILLISESGFIFLVTIPPLLSF